MFQEDFYSEMYVCIIQIRRLKKKIKKKNFFKCRILSMKWYLTKQCLKDVENIGGESLYYLRNHSVKF